MTAPKADILSKTVEYSGEKMSIRSLEEGISTVRTQQNVKVGELKTLRARNVEIQESLAEEIKKLRKFSDYMSLGELEGGFVSNLKEILSYIPGLNKLAITQRSIEELLRQQYEISARRVKQAAEFADTLKGAETDLFNEIERLNGKILDAARNEDVAAEYVLELQGLKESMEATLAGLAEGSTEQRETQADLDKIRRLLSEHSTQLQLYSTAEDRLARLKDNTSKLANTIANLSSDISQYVNAASEKLDLVAGQIQAIGTAADASVVMLEMKKSLDVMGQSMNETTQFVSETQAFFRQNLDNLMQELELYDDQTQDVLTRNLEMSKQIEDQRIAEAVKVALEVRNDQAAPAS